MKNLYLTSKFLLIEVPEKLETIYISNGFLPVLEFPAVADFPSPGEDRTAYKAIDTGKVYLWAASEYAVSEPESAGGAAALDYNYFVASYIQSSHDAPIQTVIKNTFGGDPESTYAGAGAYRVTFPEEVLTEAAAIFVSVGQRAIGGDLNAGRQDAGTVLIIWNKTPSSMDSDEYDSTTPYYLFIYDPIPAEV